MTSFNHASGSDNLEEISFRYQTLTLQLRLSSIIKHEKLPAIWHSLFILHQSTVPTT